MTLHENYFTFVSSELESHRLAALESLVSTPSDGTLREIYIWRILASFPTIAELVSLAGALPVKKYSNGTWAVVSYLLKQADQDVVGNALNSLTFSRNRALGHRALRFFNSSERPQRILYCLARYAEETIDRRYANILSSSMESDLSDAFLARSFNALFRLGVKDKLAIKVAMDLISSHIDATNMDRKAAVAATVYICFAGDKEDIDLLKSVQNKVTIPELRRLLNWGLYELNGFEKQNFSAEAAKNFLKRGANLAEPNFTGYGCFSESALLAGAKAFLGETDPSQYATATRTLLGLGNQGIIDLLADDPKMGLKNLAASGMGELVSLWKHYMPLHCQSFQKSARDPQLISFWNEHDPEVLHVMLTKEDFVAAPQGDSAGRNTASFQNVFEEACKFRRTGWMRLALDLMASQLLILERLTLNGDSGREEFEGIALQNIQTLQHAVDKDPERLLSRCVYGATLSGEFTHGFMNEVYCLLGFPAQTCAFGAFALNEKTLPPDRFSQVFSDQLELMQDQLKVSTTEPLAFQEWCAGVFQGVLVAGLKIETESKIEVAEQGLQQAAALAPALESVFSAMRESETGSTQNAGMSQANRDETEDQHADDWGHEVQDKPLLRWNAILQIFLNKALDAAQIENCEITLRDSLRVAPHLEKRWIASALVKISSDDAIKAILYQALQHVDQEFVSHTIRQLLKSPHRRAQQALIRCVGRNTISDDIKFSILDEMSLENPEELLQELKTLEILRLPPHLDDAIRDAVGRVAALVEEKTESTVPLAYKRIARTGSLDVESTIKGILPQADRLSVDTRSALRTAEMILIQSKEWGDNAVDLSPIVNMHTKAVELTLRETFEGVTDAVIRQGEISRKLDILGYARPIPEKMQIFEDYLAQLPIIRTIPYFSKFKLRKMLRGICLYRPGKRFTLDGPKAFALLFLVGSRRQCPFGLAQTLPLGFSSDAELFELIKLIHSLQDSRNRAVHEGLTWEAQDDIESMRSQAYKIIETCLRIGRTAAPRAAGVGRGA